MDWIELLAALAVILFGAQLFTNGVEWIGEAFGLSEGAVGSVLAAIGTALPETLLPLIAILSGGSVAGDEIGVGAILGAPLVLRRLGLTGGVAAMQFASAMALALLAPAHSALAAAVVVVEPDLLAVGAVGVLGVLGLDGFVEISVVADRGVEAGVGDEDGAEPVTAVVGELAIGASSLEASTREAPVVLSTRSSPSTRPAKAIVVPSGDHAVHAPLLWG